MEISKKYYLLRSPDRSWLTVSRKCDCLSSDGSYRPHIYAPINTSNRSKLWGPYLPICATLPQQYPSRCLITLTFYSARSTKHETRRYAPPSTPLLPSAPPSTPLLPSVSYIQIFYILISILLSAILSTELKLYAHVKQSNWRSIRILQSSGIRSQQIGVQVLSLFAR